MGTGVYKQDREVRFSLIADINLKLIRFVPEAASSLSSVKNRKFVSLTEDFK